MRLFVSLILILSTLNIYSKTSLSTYTYDGEDLGVNTNPSTTSFKIWSPDIESLMLRIYKKGEGGSPLLQKEFTPTPNGVWECRFNQNLEGKFYTIQAKYNGKLLNEVPDIYAKAVGVNGKRGYIVNLAKTNPKDWVNDKSHAYGAQKDAIIYELHVRDATIFTTAKNKGKFLGLAQSGLKNKQNESVGLDHLKELGVTHVHLLPIYDYFTVDESIKNNPQYNWGYDPLNYNSLEGGYSTNAVNPNTRIKEFKTLVQTLHKHKINVVMDVVYNHTMHGQDSYFSQIAPQYYYRYKNDGTWSNASGCGNETASDQPMFRKFMISSLKHWMKEYHVDGFRFDLMGIHDIETMTEIATELRKINPNVLLYGEGWTAGDSPLPEEKRALKKYASKLNGIAVFSDDIRDGAKGSVFEHQDRGFVSGKKGMEESIKFGLIGAGQHRAIDYTKVNYSKEPYTTSPDQIISYSECHDNHTLWDRFNNSNKDASDEDKRRMQKLSLAIVMTGQGIPFIHAGQEFCRTKKGEENSYKSPDSINGIDWDRKSAYKEVNTFTQHLIAIRKAHPSFRLGNAKLVDEHVSFPITQDGVIVMKIQGLSNDSWKQIFAVYNATEDTYDVSAIAKGAKLVLSSEDNTAENPYQVKRLSFSLLVVE